MYHRTRWAPEKTGQRLELIAPLIYRKQKTLPSFRYTELDGPVRLRAGFAVEAAWETNLLEENESIRLNLRPYQIMTIRLKESAA